MILQLYRLYLRALFRWKYGDARFPRTLRLEISSHCNRRCAYCPNSFAPNPVRFISDDVLDAFLKRIREINYPGAVDFIFFNEPLLHTGLPSIVRQVKLAAPRCHPVVSTNGDLLTPELVFELVEEGVVKIFAMHHRPDRPGWWNNINGLKKRWPGVIQATDITEMENASGLYDYGGKVEVNKVRERNWSKGLPICDMHEACGQIDINGDWLLCCVDYSRSNAFGNIKHQGLLEIWNNPEFQKIRKDLRGGFPMLGICQECACFTGR